MFWHWIIFGVLAFTAFLENFCCINKKSIVRICNFVTIVVIVLSSIRWNQKAADWDSYKMVFDLIRIDTFSDLFFRHAWDFEPLFNMLMRLVSALNGNYLFVQIFMALLSIGLTYKAAIYLYSDAKYKERYYSLGSRCLALSLLVYWATESMGLYAVRMSISMGICLFSIRYIEKKELKKFLLCILIGLGFHMSTVVFIPAYYLYHKKLNIRQILLFLACTILLSVIGAPTLLKIPTLLGGRIGLKAEGYNFSLNDSYFDMYSMSGTFILAKAFANTVLVVIIAIYISRKVRNDDRTSLRVNGIANLYLFGAMIQFVFLPYSMLVSRMSMYYIIQQYFLIPLILLLGNKNKANKMLLFMVIVLYCALKMYLMLESSAEYSTFNTVFTE